MKKILIADDSVGMRKMVSAVLEEARYNVITAVDGKDALNKLPDTQPDLIITDVNMPNMNGLEFVKALRALPQFRFTPVLVLTTEGSQDMKLKGREDGATGWLTKPFQPQKLLNVVHKVLTR